MAQGRNSASRPRLPTNDMDGPIDSIPSLIRNWFGYIICSVDSQNPAIARVCVDFLSPGLEFRSMIILDSKGRFQCCLKEEKKNTG